MQETRTKEKMEEKFKQIKEAIRYNLTFQKHGYSINKIKEAKENVNFIEYQFCKLKNKRCFKGLKEENDYFECYYSVNDKCKKLKNCETEKDVKTWLEKVYKEISKRSFGKIGEININIYRMGFNYETKRYEEVRENYY